MPKEKILVVDDDAAIRYTLLEALRERGDDVLWLAGFYLKRCNEQLRKRIRGLTSEVAYN